MSTPSGLAPDASTSATQADAWTQAENNALASATQFDNTARTARQQAGLLANRPDMTATTKRLNAEATAAEETADTRRGLARGYAALRSLQDGEPTMSGTHNDQTTDRDTGSGTSSEPDDVDDYDEDEEPIEPEVYTTCWECDEPLEKPTTREEDSVHPDCDPDKPPKYWFGELAPNGKKIDPENAESFRREKDLAAEMLDRVLEWETPYGELFISFPDGSLVDAREWIERPENLELAGGRDQYAGRGEVDPEAPDRCWMGQTLPSGAMARPLARSYDDVGELATDVCKRVYEDKRHPLNSDIPYTVMLPGGELVDAYEWAQRPETRRLAGYTPVEFDPDAPDRCWMGQTQPSEPDAGPIRRLATSYEDVGELAADVCKKVYEDKRGRLDKDSDPFTVMLPGGELVDAYEWAQRPETRRLAGYTPVEFDPESPDRCWLGQTMPGDGPVHQLATSYDNVEELAAGLCDEIFDKDRIHSRTPHTVMLPGGEMVDAYDWAQQPETRRLAGCTTVRNRVQYEARATCDTCNNSLGCTAEQVLQGEIGQQRMAQGALHCDDCDTYAMTVPVPVTLIDDASAAEGAAPRIVGEPG